eukprot:scaffold24_cov245-Pinguiococcus_pyrenoidosus.AAC.14
MIAVGSTGVGLGPHCFPSTTHRGSSCVRSRRGTVDAIGTVSLFWVAANRVLLSPVLRPIPVARVNDLPVQRNDLVQLMPGDSQGRGQSGLEGGEPQRPKQSSHAHDQLKDQMTQVGRAGAIERSQGLVPA